MSKNSLERQIMCYPNHKYHRIFIAFCNTNKYNKSEGMCEILRKFFDSNFSDHQLNKFIEHYEGMNNEERHYPGRITDTL